MAGSKSGARPTRRNGRTVGRAGNSGPWPKVFLAALVSLTASIVVLVLVAADSFTGDGSGSGGAPAGEPDTPVSVATPSATPGELPSPPPASTERPTPGPDGIVVVACGDILVPLDKQHRLPADCEPPDLVRLPDDISHGGAQYLRPEALDALLSLLDAARRDGYELLVNSSYRSYAVQEQTYATWVSLYGQEYADRTSARPGHSEHQLGTTVDVGARGRFLEDFVGTPEADWLAENAWKYGFIVSYPEGKERITGYAYEPWHIRYVGPDVAADVHHSGLTLREYLLKR
ncbi:MAG: hypothetical protein KatS3mg062_1229 [Tepidiforma sp.]|nr:MAG: hypothetical protein KatS3mg062_1229 [Tepidiforma sp.]